MAIPEEMPIGASAKRDIATLTRNLEVLRGYSDAYIVQLRQIEERLTTLESKLLVIRAINKQGAWFSFWRKHFLGIVDG